MAAAPRTDAGRGPSEAGVSAIGPRTVVERPPPGLAQGRYAWPAWAVSLVGGLAVLVGLGYLIWRLRKRRRS